MKEKELKQINIFTTIIGIVFILGSLMIISELYRYDLIWYDITACVGRSLLILIAGIVLIRIKFY